ncbi:dihydrodipicolinate synthase family protein [uncultured Salegentibacter sp.]|uniref:dihydrodipicolinate synthase family protein n=1 Tax=uncultured Salegentibacter sp. TaxID=259320 RepID=UPI0025930356|nr:dihydrodipicolinate synthase family protein [uncultured Salegentibacter sp.]
MKNMFAATYAPMKEDFSLNPEVVANYSKFLLRNKVFGVFINGSTGDFVSLTGNERIELLEAWSEQREKGLYLINHVGSNSLKEAEDLAKASVGKADAIAAIAPFYFKPANLQQLLDYCKVIAVKANDLPFYYYHLPVLTGVNFSMTAFAEMAKKQIPNFAGIKFTENNLVEFQKTNLNHPDLDIFFGVDEAFCSSLSSLSKGWVGSTYNHLSPLFHEIKAESDKGNFQKVLKLQNLVVTFVETLSSYGSFNGSGKSFMSALGVNCGPSRFPHPTLSTEELENVSKTFDTIGVSAYFSS